MKKLFLLVCICCPSIAYAFPVAVGVIGAGVLGTLFWPVLIIAGGIFWLGKRKRGTAFLIAGAGVVLAFAMVLSHDFAGDRLPIANYYNEADSSILRKPLPFPFLPPEAQAVSAQAVTAEEFVDGLSSGHFKALKISNYPSLFSEEGQVSTHDIWTNKDLLIDAAEGRGGRVVLVDEFGGIAGTIAESAREHFGLNLGFLEGGTTALSRYGWDVLRSTTQSETVHLDDYKRWLKDHPDATILSITTDTEFVKDGWMFGDHTMTLADFVANYDRLFSPGEKVFLSSYETNDIGATPIVLTMLERAGVRVSYVPPRDQEILFKEPYYSPYLNDSRIVSFDDAKRYILTRPDIIFLDFSEGRWEVADRLLEGRYFHLSMLDVAAGKLPAFVESLDPTKAYVGLAFDRRTAYHSLLAGELLTSRGAEWLGRFTLPSVLTDEHFNNEDLTSLPETFSYWLKSNMAGAGAAMLSHRVSVVLAAVVLIGLSFVSMSSARIAWKVGAGLAIVALYSSFAFASNDYPRVVLAYRLLLIAGTVAAVAAFTMRRLSRTPGICAVSAFTPSLPDKAAYLNEAAVQGYTVAPGIVLSRHDDPMVCTSILKEGSYIVRSAVRGEASQQWKTAGIYQSLVAETRAEIPSRIKTVFEHFQRAGVEGSVLVQPFIEAEFYGVAQFMDAYDSGFLICELGEPGAVTGGKAPSKTFKVSVRAARKAPLLARKPAEALIALSRQGAVSIEFAITKSGRMTLLQVNKDHFRACAESRFIELHDQTVLEVPAGHRDPVSAAVVAALAPGNMIAAGNRRFAIESSFYRVAKEASRDLEHLGFHRSELPGDFHIAWLDAYHSDLLRPVPSEGPASFLIDVVAASIRECSDTLGRFNRFATVALSIGRAGAWNGPARFMPSTTVEISRATPGYREWDGMIISPLAGFDIYQKSPSYVSEQLASVPVLAPSPAAYLKDASSMMMMVRLEVLRPAIISIIEQGGAELLLHKLGTQVGLWDAMQQEMEVKERSSTPQPLCRALGPSTDSRKSWRIPFNGLTGTVSTPDAFIEGGILYVDSCSMEYLHMLKRSRAIIASSGSITSHLMQHAAASGLPVVIDSDIGALGSGDRIAISRAGAVLDA